MVAVAAVVTTYVDKWDFSYARNDFLSTTGCVDIQHFYTACVEGIFSSGCPQRKFSASTGNCGKILSSENPFYGGSFKICNALFFDIKQSSKRIDTSGTLGPTVAPVLVSARKGGKNRFKRGLFTSRPLLKITPPECSGEAVLPRRKCKRFPPCRIREGNRFYTQSTNRRPIGRFYSPVKSARSEVPHWPRASPGTPSAN